MKYIEGNQVMSYSELVIPEDDCPLSSLFTLPISKGVTNTPPLPSSAAVSPPGQQFVPVHYPYHQVRFQQVWQLSVEEFGWPILMR